MRTPRKLKKKKSKNGILIYDVCGLPETWTMTDVLNAFHNSQIVVWDSCSVYNKRGDFINPPTVVNNLKSIKIVDLSNK